MIRVLIVDDHKVVRQGLQVFLGQEPDIEIVGEATNGREAVERVGALHPDVVLMDLVMPEMDGIAATTAIKRQFSDVEVIAMTSFIEDEKVFAAMQAGTTGYLLKDAAPDDVTKAIRLAARGQVHLDPRAAARLMRELRPHTPEHAEADALTPREQEVLRLLARGLSNSEIAQALVVSDKTAKSHVSSILSKLGLASRTQAVIYALKVGLVQLDEIEIPSGGGE
jgi:DNA-binding NarL/FixJ family response regulator